MELISVAAVAENGTIGEGDEVPWNLPEDKKQYRERVAGHPTIFGRRTYEMFADPPGSAYIVLSRTEREWDREDAYHAGGVADAIEILDSLGADRAYVLGGGAIYELSPEAFEDMRVIGSLHQWDASSRRVYEVVEYNRTHNVAVGNWRETKPESALAAERTPEDAITAVRELLQNLEPDVAEAREIRRRFRGIVRELDADRAEAQQAILDEHVAPDLGSSRAISDVIDEQIPEDLHPRTGESDADMAADDVAGRVDNGDDPDDKDDEPDGETVEKNLQRVLGLNGSDTDG
jgi:dihydrofolate reductase